MTLEFLAVVVLIRLGMYALQSVTGNFDIKIRLLRTLLECDFCLGCWAYWVGLWVFGMGEIKGLPYVPVFSELLWGIGISFIVHLIVLGWKAKFETIIID